MKTLKLINDDLVFENNELVMISGGLEECQSIERILTTNIKEWFLNSSFGFEYALLKRKRVDKNAIRMGVIDAVTQDARVQSVLSVNVDFDNTARKVAINFKALMKSGNSVESEVIL